MSEVSGTVELLTPCVRLVRREKMVMGRVRIDLERCGRPAVVRDVLGDTYCKRHAKAGETDD